MMERLEVKVTRDDPQLPIPSYQHPGDAGMDVCAAEDRILQPLERALIPTGLRVAVPSGYEMQIRPRSGLALNHGLTVLNAPGTVDSGYRGPVQVLMINLGTEPFRIQRGQRVAQLVFAPVCRAEFVPVGQLPPSSRGQDGFGSTKL